MFQWWDNTCLAEIWARRPDTRVILTVIYEIAIVLQITEQFFIGRYLISDAQFQEI